MSVVTRDSIQRVTDILVYSVRLSQIDRVILLKCAEQENSGVYFATESSQLSFFCSSKIMIDIAVNCLVTEPILEGVSVAKSDPVWKFAFPNALR